MSETRDSKSRRSRSSLDRSFKSFLQKGVSISTRFPIQLILLSVLLAVFGGYCYFFRLQVITDRDQLLNSQLESNTARQLYREHFGDDRYLILVISKPFDTGLPEKPDAGERELMKRIARDWSERLRKRPDLFPKVVDRLDWESFDQVSILYIPYDDLAGVTGYFGGSHRTLENWLALPTLDGLFRVLDQALLSAAESNDSQSDADVSLIKRLEGLIRSVRRDLEAPVQNSSHSVDGTPEIKRGGFLGDELTQLRNEFFFDFSNGLFDTDGYLFFSGGRILTVFSDVVGDPNRQNRYQEALEYAQEQLDEVLDSSGEGFDAGLAGFPALEYEEMKTGLRDLTRGTLITLALVSMLFMWGFKRLLHPALAAICLCLALGITCGFVWLFIGHLNLIAMVFAIIMVAVGIDFAIHITTHYEQFLTSGFSPKDALGRTMGSVGGAVWLGGITTAAAFFAAYFTEFRGLAELGLIAGAGLLICLGCTCFVYPAMLFLVDTRLRKNSAAFTRRRSLGFHLNLPAASPGRWSTIVLSVAAALLAAGYCFGQYYVDTNLLNLQMEDGKANRWQRLLLATDDVATFAIATFPDRSRMEEVRAKLEASDLVRRTEGLYPYRESEKRALLNQVCASISGIEVTESNETDLFESRRSLWSLRQRIRKYGNVSQEAREYLGGTEQELSAIYKLLGDISSGARSAELAPLETDLRDLSREALVALRRYSCPPAFSEELVPSLFRQRFLGSDGGLALFIYPAKNVWNREALEEFVVHTRKIAPSMFGEVISFYENGRSLIKSFLQSALYALALILCLLMLWSRSVRVTFLAVSPLIFSVGLLLGIMRWGPHPVPWNYANFFALPILIGIGVDSGIHLVRAWNSGVPSEFSGAAKAVLLSSLTTIIGFGVLASSDHVGVSSLGYILFWGIILCLICSLTLLPTALRVFGRKDANEKV